MSAFTTALLAELAQRGIKVRVAEGRLACSPTTALTHDLRLRIVFAKAELLELLGAQTTSSFVQSPQAGTDRTDKSPTLPPSVSSVSGRQGGAREIGRPSAVCLSCYGTRFVRLSNGRRSVWLGCERPPANEILGEDDGVIGGQR